jgi:hypothetical protein
VAKHEWREFGGDMKYPFQRLRECVKCHAVQKHTTEHLWMRVVGCSWQPLVGRCKPGRGKRNAPGRDLLVKGDQ